MEHINIVIDDLASSKVIAFLNDHLQHMIKITPPGCVHALDIEALKKPEITFWSVWKESELVCCGALKELNSNEAELKSMRTSPTHLGKGIASHLLEYILSEAKKRGYHRISLETGSYEAFKPARNLYEKFGFKYCKPFSDYSENPNSVFMTIELKTCGKWAMILCFSMSRINDTDSYAAKSQNRRSWCTASYHYQRYRKKEDLPFRL